MLSDRELERYRRQILLFGEDGQEKLKSAEIFIAGAGGLGCPVSLYLAAAGVGKITIADSDTVDLTNLNRQILHYTRDIGKKKAASAEEKLAEINPEIQVSAIDVTIKKTNAARLVGNADGIVDAMDNFSTRYLLNETAVAKKIPLFHGAIRGLYGQATTILPGRTPCLKCIFPNPPPTEVFPALGVTAGIIGMVQSTEVIKYITGDGRLLAGRLFLWDGRGSSAEEVRVEKDPGCPVCCSDPSAHASGRTG